MVVEVSKRSVTACSTTDCNSECHSMGWSISIKYEDNACNSHGMSAYCLGSQVRPRENGWHGA